MHQKKAYYSFCVRLAQDLALVIKEMSLRQKLLIKQIIFCNILSHVMNWKLQESTDQDGFS